MLALYETVHTLVYISENDNINNKKLQVMIN